jgi:hypothetical protein
VIAGVVDTGDKFITSEQLSLVTTTPTVNHWNRHEKLHP